MFPRFFLLICLVSIGTPVPAVFAQPAKEKDKDKGKKVTKADKGDKKEKPDAKAGGEDKTGGEESDDTAPMQGIGKLLPLGETNVGVKAPTFTGGQLKSMFMARTLTRESDQILFIEGLEMNRYGKTAAQQLSISSPEARYFMESKLLFSDHRSRVTRSDFTLEGDELTFDNEHQRGKMTGNVVMEITSPEPKKTATPPAGATKTQTAGSPATSPNTPAGQPSSVPSPVPAKTGAPSALSLSPP